MCDKWVGNEIDAPKKKLDVNSLVVDIKAAASPEQWKELCRLDSEIRYYDMFGRYYKNNDVREKLVEETKAIIAMI